MRRLFVLLAVLMGIPGVAWAGGGGIDTSSCTGYGEGTSVSMQDSCFEGTAHFAPSGTTITVSNDGALTHTLTAVDGSFDTGQVAPGGTAELTIDEPGIYRIFCSLHGTPEGEGTAGVLVVGEPDPAAVAATSDTLAISAAVEGENASSMPQVIGVTDDVSIVSLVVLLMVGLATGLALSALLTVLRFRVAERS